MSKDAADTIRAAIDRWPLIRRSLSEVVSSRRLELVDEIIEDIYAVLEKTSG